MTPKEKLLKMLPKALREAVKDLDPEDGLVDECKYMLYWSDNYADAYNESGSCFPVKSLKEAAEFVRYSLHKLEKK